MCRLNLAGGGVSKPRFLLFEKNSYMKRITMFLLTCVFIVSLSAQAEQTKGKCDDQRCQTMMKLKRAFIEENFILGDAGQHKQFWDAYSKLEKSEFEAFQQQQKMKTEAGLPKLARGASLDTLSNEQILAFYKIKFQIRDQKYKAEKTFFEEICKCLSPKQINEYYQLEKKFKRTAVSKEEHKRLNAKGVPASKSPTSSKPSDVKK